MLLTGHFKPLLPSPGEQRPGTAQPQTSKSCHLSILGVCLLYRMNPVPLWGSSVAWRIHSWLPTEWDSRSSSSSFGTHHQWREIFISVAGGENWSRGTDFANACVGYQARGLRIEVRVAGKSTAGSPHPGNGAERSKRTGACPVCAPKNAARPRSNPYCRRRTGLGVLGTRCFRGPCVYAWGLIAIFSSWG